MSEEAHAESKTDTSETAALKEEPKNENSEQIQTENVQVEHVQVTTEVESHKETAISSKSPSPIHENVAPAAETTVETTVEQAAVTDTDAPTTTSDIAAEKTQATPQATETEQHDSPSLSSEIAVKTNIARLPSCMYTHEQLITHWN